MMTSIGQLLTVFQESLFDCMIEKTNMIIRNHPTDGLKGKKHIAQGAALGYVLNAPLGRARNVGVSLRITCSAGFAIRLR